MSASLIKSLDWRKHKLTLSLLIAGSIFFVFFWNNHTQVRDAYKKTLAKLEGQKNKNAYANEQLILYRENVSRYDYLLNKGVVGESQRLQWLETIQDVSEDFGVPKIDFRLANARRATQEADYYWSDLIPFNKTLLEVDFELLHEGDFYDFFKGFREHSQGLFSIERCKINRRASGATGSVFAGLNGSCELSAYTLDDVRATHFFEEQSLSLQSAESYSNDLAHVQFASEMARYE